MSGSSSGRRQFSRWSLQVLNTPSRIEGVPFHPLLIRPKCCSMTFSPNACGSQRAPLDSRQVHGQLHREHTPVAHVLDSHLREETTFPFRTMYQCSPAPVQEDEKVAQCAVPESLHRSQATASFPSRTQQSTHEHHHVAAEGIPAFRIECGCEQLQCCPVALHVLQDISFHRKSAGQADTHVRGGIPPLNQAGCTAMVCHKS